MIINFPGNNDLAWLLVHFTRFLMRTMATSLWIIWRFNRVLFRNLRKRDIQHPYFVNVFIQVTDNVSHEKNFVNLVTLILVELTWDIHQLLFSWLFIEACSWRSRLKSLIKNWIILINFKTMWVWYVALVFYRSSRSRCVWI